MRIAFVILFAVMIPMFALAQTASLSQRVNLHFTNTPLKDVLQKISSTYGVQFSYSKDRLSTSKRVSIYAENQPLNKTLDKLFKDNDIAYAYIGDQMVLRAAKKKSKDAEAIKMSNKSKPKTTKKEKTEPTETKTTDKITVPEEVEEKPKKVLFTEAPEPKREMIETVEVNTISIEENATVSPTIKPQVQDQNFWLSDAPEIVAPQPQDQEQPMGQMQTAGQHRAFQISLAPYVGTNFNKLDRDTKFSINLLGGMNGSVSGMEIGAGGNILVDNMRGAQFAGVFNIVGGSVSGMQGASVFNVAKGSVVGMQSSCVFNYSGELNGIQLSAIANQNKGRMNGLQGSTIWNKSESVQGAQLTVIANHSLGEVNGLQGSVIQNYARGVRGGQFSVVHNMNKGNLIGMQTTVVSNVSNDVYGMQISGVSNIATGNLQGAQLAGLGNVATGKSSNSVQIAGVYNYSEGRSRMQTASVVNVADETNFQLSGVVNVAKKVKGVQLGIVNIADSVQGVPIGLINIVRKNGYNRIEVSGGDAMHVNFQIKAGAYSFYNMYHVGKQFRGKTWSIGYGVGTAVKVSKRLVINLEALAMHVNENEAWTTNLNLLNQGRLGFEFRLWKRLSVFAAPNFNVAVSRLYNADTQTYGTQIAPYTFYDKTSANNTNTKMWIGFTGGIRF